MFQSRAFTAEELGHMSLGLATLGNTAERPLGRIQVNHKAGHTPHATDPWGAVLQDGEEWRQMSE